MALKKTVIFLSAELLGHYTRLGRATDTSRSEALRTALELGLERTREVLFRRDAARKRDLGRETSPMPSFAQERPLTLLGVIRELSGHAERYVKSEPHTDSRTLRAFLVRENENYGVAVPDQVLDEIVRDYAGEDSSGNESPELMPLPGDEPPR